MKAKRIFALALGLLLSAASPAFAASYTISVNQFVEHPALNSSVEGFKTGLAESGVEAKYLEHNAQANMPTVLQIVSQIQGEKPDLILAVATPSAQATAQRIKDTPILFTAVTDPVSASLVASMEKPGGNVSGTSDMNPVKEQMALLREIHPTAKNVGVIYNAGEANSVVQVKMVKKAAHEQGFTIVESPAINSASIFQAAKNLVGKVDVIYLPTDNTVMSNMEAVIKVCVENKIPLYPAESDAVKRGGVASASVSYYELGKQAGHMAAKILRGEAKVGDMPVETAKNISLVLNMKMAQEMGITFPDSVMKRAQEVLR